MASDLGGGGRTAERRTEAVDPDALRDLGRRPRRYPAKADRPHPRVPARARADRPLAARRNRAERGVSRGMCETRTSGRDGIPRTEVPRDVRREQSDRISGGDFASLLREGMSSDGTATEPRRDSIGRTDQRDVGAVERAGRRIRVRGRDARDPDGRCTRLARRVSYAAARTADGEDAWGRI